MNENFLHIEERMTSLTNEREMERHIRKKKESMPKSIYINLGSYTLIYVFSYVFILYLLFIHLCCILLHLVWKGNCKYPLLQAISTEIGWKVCGYEHDEWDVIWHDHGANIGRVVKAAKQYQRVNHFPGMVHIYRKGHLARVMAKMQTICSADEFNFCPRTW